jgi:hypothetical protein
VFTIYVDSVSASDDASLRWGKVSFVDLAGSERLKESKSTGEMARETGAINRSLFALGKVRVGAVCFAAAPFAADSAASHFVVHVLQHVTCDGR